MTDSSLTSIKSIFDHLFHVMTMERFLKMEGLGNEVPFFIFPYDPKEEIEIMRMCQNLIRKLATLSVKVVEINLYDVAINLLKQQGKWAMYIEEEKNHPKNELLEDLQSSLSPEGHMIPAIMKEAEKADPFDILFLTGVGQVFPYIRSHTILNNLQSKAKDYPTVMWFPGKYSYSDEKGSSLDLFGRLHDDKYYRAFDILKYQV